MTAQMALAMTGFFVVLIAGLFILIWVVSGPRTAVIVMGSTLAMMAAIAGLFVLFWWLGGGFEVGA